ncbi:S66 peptidase family protein [Evansella sp. AB-rgal1]|uniref:S66 family peptidase n=1 Tax=Evansella sp. AB-rgal1 TaxID=3242696 RepID=UPI00359E76FD
MIPNKLKAGDEVRVISPATSLAIVDESVRKLAVKRLKDLGLNVRFSKNAEEIDEGSSSTIESRMDDLHEAFADKNVKAILTTLGGYNSNQLLKYINYELIKNNPKIFCGYSDITALSNAIYRKTGLITYSGPHFSTFGMEKGANYTLDFFKKCMIDEEPINIVPASYWSDDKWYMNQTDRHFIKNSGYSVICEGSGEGTLIGGNLCTLNLLQGTEFMPSLKNSVLFIEDDYESNALTFDRDLQSVLHLPDFEAVRGIVIGRFQKGSNISEETIRKIVHSKKELSSIPVIYHADFGHTTPIFTFPIGGHVKIQAKDEQVKIIIVHH